MFGYVKPYKPELKVKDFEIYKSVYCGLCHTLKKRYGFAARFILSYDTTFLALFLASVNPDCAGFEKKRCPASPFRKRSCCRSSDSGGFAADVSVILAYYKLEDTLRDSGFFKKAAAVLLKPLLGSFHKKAARNAPSVEKLAYEYIENQFNIEAKEETMIDEAADPTGKLLAGILTLKAGNEIEERIYKRLGYFLGRWIYISDAADDFEDDIKSGNFNALLTGMDHKQTADIKEIKKMALKLLHSCVAEIAAAAELIKYYRFEDIIKNIIYCGLPEVQKSIILGKNKEDHLRELKF